MHEDTQCSGRKFPSTRIVPYTYIHLHTHTPTSFSYTSFNNNLEGSSHPLPKLILNKLPKFFFLMLTWSNDSICNSLQNIILFLRKVRWKQGPQKLRSLKSLKFKTRTDTEHLHFLQPSEMSSRWQNYKDKSIQNSGDVIEKLNVTLWLSESVLPI